jgi:predicted nucleic acid-binding protein
MTFLRQAIPVVLDASVAVEAALGGDADADAIEAWLGARRMMLVPDHFWPETANALLVRRRLPIDAVRLRLASIAAAGLERVPTTTRRLDEAVGLAHANRLSVYDALYLQVAIETDASLATHDKALARAADAEGVVLEPLD